MNAEPTAAASLRPGAAASMQPNYPLVAQNRGPVLLVCAALIVIVFAVFAQSCRFDFVNYDDGIAVYDNPFVRAGLTAKSLAWAFKPNDYEYWIPLTSISHMIDCQLYGLKAGGHHLTNILLHAASAILLFLGLRRLTGAFWRSAFVAAVWAIHPLRAESIGWVVERKDLLAGLFFMLALFFYGRGLWRNIAVTACFILGFLSKPMVITLPFLLLLLDYWPGGRISKLSDWKKPVLEKLPMLLLIPFLAVLTVITQGHAPGALQTLESYSMPARIANALMSCVIYIKQTFCPTGLVVFYSRTEVNYAVWVPILAGLAVAGISILAIVYRKKFPFLLTGWLWYLGMLVPVLGLFAIGTIAHADRYTYFPQIGFLIMATWAAVELWPGSKAALGPIAALIVGLLAVLTFHQTKHWRDSETLWKYTLDVNPKSLLAHNNLGVEFYKQHEREAARIEFEKALEISPKFAQAHNNLGMILAEQGHLGDAITHYRKAVDSDPLFFEAQNNLGNALRKEHKFDEAIVHFKKAIELKPDFAQADFNLGKTLLMNGNFGAASDAYLAGLKIQPEFLSNRGVQKDVFDIAWALATSPDASIRNGAKAIQLAETGYIDSHGNTMLLSALAAGYAESGDFKNAISTAEQGIQLATQRGESEIVSGLQNQLKLYRANKPFRETPTQ